MLPALGLSSFSFPQLTQIQCRTWRMPQTENQTRSLSFLKFEHVDDPPWFFFLGEVPSPLKEFRLEQDFFQPL